MHIKDVDLEDYHDLVNALKDGPSVPASASLHIRWRDVKNRFKVRDATNGFAARFTETAATIEWSGEESGFKFVTDPAKTSISRLALIGREHNGIFFPHSDNEDNQD